jgi:hypothetical protein
MPRTDPTQDQDPDARAAYWRRRLGRIKLGVEPIPEQVERHRKVAVVFSAIATGIALMFVALFSAFRQPLVGVALGLILMGPLILICWLDFLRLRSRATAYLREQEQSRP